ncbi:SusC/RagA family TonB-linked outer membrane protein [Parabacteroides goldsteinii]|uniref:SusC/RagA family TonB-linked outer membrane protein n=6 Tax=Parabacteroides goldsteinii TaxID=328812 RepID=A0A6G1ZC47_9BACT|nr:SusC/RagA family TonB-linked outer membrane protein [Parabacteroides goldsteinii]MRX91889.1 SusC/RagA family TonB-linked outer membrane protein [Parabacteroides goldsteinii]MRX99630.1 SusC/RagA family TonB-linked outer membrane protein [Parabacteroides goldsteinii]MRY02675.1 SusC/RagA family TonB-linked outer membrane protein [Parabacteroides goldsteinii]MRY11523.1 SusC/RagA family TonB-linked outer membrane protein [Parabacteroides goldsteinii]MRY20876.1 SusC/RagA family TonB-linked outer 
MLKRFKSVSMILLAGALGFTGNAVANPNTGNPAIDISQQDTKITGTVEDEFGPVAGASVVIKGTTNGTMTDMNGHFTLEGVKKGDIIQISFIGFATQDIPYTGQTALNVKLEEDAQKLDEVVVTALGMKRDKKALGYAMQELKGDELLSSREPNLANSLSGKVSGLQIVRSSNGVGGSSKIVLRGNNSLTGSNQPLIVVDGTPMDNFTGGVDDVWGNSGADMGNGLSDINPEDIESMTVLKGASAAALYGSRAGNGVILITTKSGKKNEGLGITVNAGITTESIFLKPDMQNSFGQGSVGAYDNQSRLSWGPKAEGQTVTDWMGRQVPLRTYDNIDAFFNTGTSFNEGISFQQNIKGTSVFSSINRSDDAGITPESKLNKTNITLRATTFLDEAEKWKVDAKVNYINLNAHNRPIQGVNPSNAFNTIYNLPRSLNVADFKNSVDEDGNMIWWDASKNPQENPYWVTKYRQNNDTRNRLLGNIALKYAPTNWFNIELRGGTDYYTTTKNEKVYAGGNTTPSGLYSEGSETFYENNYSFLATANKDNLIDRLGGFVTFGGNLMIQRRTKMNASAGELLVPNLFSLNNGINKPTVTSELIRRKMNSLYGSLQLNWDGYLFLDITARNDWSSTMSKANRSYFYPSVSLSGVISDMVPKLGGQMPEWFTFAKVRASYAEVGNDLDPYQLYNNFTVGKDENGNTTAAPGNVLYDSSVRSELIKSWEAGFDIRFFNNRLGLDAAWYKTNATRQLLNLPMDPFSGYSSRKVNAGNIQNEGVEISLNGLILDNPKGLSWNSTAQFSLNRNKIIDLYPGVTLYDIKTLDAIQIVAVQGSYYGDIYGQTFQRVEDKNDPNYGKIIVGEDGLPLITTGKSKVGNQSPDWMLGWTNSFSYKGFNLSFLVDFRIGGDLYSATASNLYTRGNAAGTVVNGERQDFIVPNSVVQTPNDYTENKVPVTHQNYWERIGSTGNYGLPEMYTYDATNIRLRNITLGYDFNKAMLKNTPFQHLRLSATCNNVWMIHYNLPGIDPESVSATNTNATGFENGAAPTSRSFTFNVTVGF